MNKLILILTLCYTGITAQDIKGNYTIETFNGNIVLNESSKFNRRTAENKQITFDNSDIILLQFYENPKLNIREALKFKGCELVAYAGSKTYIAIVKQYFNQDMFVQFNVRANSAVPNQLKLDVDLYKLAQNQTKNNDLLEIDMRYFSTLNLQKIKTDLTKDGFKITNTDSINSNLSIQLYSHQIEKLAEKAYVFFLAKKPLPQNTGNSTTADRYDSPVRANYLSQIYGFNGTGVVVGINDITRVDRKDIDFRNRLIYKTTDMGSPSERHPTWVAMHSMRSGNTSPKKIGASNLKIITPVEDGSSNYEALYNSDSLRIINRSMGNAGDVASGAYTSASANIDDLCNRKPYFMICYSSGNGGGNTERDSYGLYTDLATISPQLNKDWARLTGETKQSKNTVCVNSFDIDDEVTSSGSAGPAFDGRIKPDVCATGGATSYATPKVTALFGVLFQAYKAKHGGAEPYASYIKAIVLNSADDVYKKGPDFRTGFGKVNYKKAYESMQDSLLHIVNVDQSDNINVFTNPKTVPPGNWAQLKIMVYWHDKDLSTGTNKALVNDVDMEVTYNGITKLPYVLDHSPITLETVLAQPFKDHRNNVEQVVIENPVAGQSFQIKLLGYDVPYGPQRCIVVYHYLPKTIQIIHPLGGESFKPDENEYIRWDADGFSSGTPFVIDYWNEATSQWTNIASVSENKRFYQFLVPPALEGIKYSKIRITKDGFTSISDTISFADDVKKLKVDWRCNTGSSEDAGIKWASVKDAAQYEVYRLGKNDRFMQLYTTTTDTTAVITNISLSDTTDYVAVLPVRADGLKGNRCDAVEIERAYQNCNSVQTIGASNVDANSAILHASIFPKTDNITNVVFQYKNPQGSAVNFNTPDAGIFSGSTSYNYEKSVTLPSELNTFDIIEYRILAEKKAMSGINPKDSGDWLPLQVAGGYAAELSGVGAYGLAAIEELGGNNPRTIELWAKVNSFNDGELFGLGNPETTSENLEAFVIKTTTTSNKFQMVVNDGKEYLVELPNSQGEWHHYALTYDGSLITFYYDGKSVASLTKTLATSSENLRIANSLAGEIDELRIWSRARTKAEINQMMHFPIQKTFAQGKYTYPGNLLRYVQFNDGQSSPFESVVLDKIIASTPLPNSVSTVPLGYFESGTLGSETTGSVTWAGQNFQANFSVQNGAEIGVSEITTLPHNQTIIGLPTDLIIKDLFTQQYWISHRHDLTPVAYNLTLSTDELTLGDESNPDYIILLGRNRNSADDWSYIGQAQTVSEANKTATFLNLADFNQFLLARKDFPLNIENFSATSDLLIYPNPVQNGNLITIQNSNLEGNVNLLIFDTSGKKVLEKILTSKTEIISTNGLNSGIYTLQLIGNKQIFNSRIIVN